MERLRPAEIIAESLPGLRELLDRGLRAHADLAAARERERVARVEEDAAQMALRNAERELARVYEQVHALNYHDIGHLRGVLPRIE
jgi:hypothetical protein